MSHSLGNGLTVLGSEEGCGKSALVAGLAGVLQEEGFQIQALKPIVLGNKAKAEYDLAFIHSVSHTKANYAVQYAEEDGGLSERSFEEALAICRSSIKASIIELPGSACTPLVAGNEGQPVWKDSARFALELGQPCLIVGKATLSGLSQILLNVLYCQGIKLNLIGMVQVEIKPGNESIEKRREILTRAIENQTSVKLLGLIKHSPSIVVGSNQGNLLKSTASALDLLPIIKAMDLRISV